MYTGMILFKGTLHDNYFNHYLILTYITRILYDRMQLNDNSMLQYADELTKLFISQYKKIYNNNVI